MEHPVRIGKYEIEQCLGGSMAKVYRARDTVLGRRVALKLLTEAGTADEKSEGVKLTKAGFTLGTPYYMAPEQVMGHALTAQADVYSFGVLVFELLTGTKPISGESVEKIFDRILHEPLNMEPLKALKVPRELSDLI